MSPDDPSVASWTDDRKRLAQKKRLLAAALDENMSVRLTLTDGTVVQGKVIGEKLEGEMTSGNRVAYRATLALYSRDEGFTGIDLMNVETAKAIPYVPN